MSEGKTADSKRVANRPYDEAVDLEGSLDESVETHVNLSQSIVQSPPGQASGGGRGHAAAQAHGAPYGGERGDSPPRVREDARGEYAGSAAEIPGGSRVGADDAASTLSDSAGGEAGESTVSTGGAIMPAGAYKASDYASLPVSEDIRGLFKYITSYKAHDIKLETVLKPFIPDYMPALGSIDSFIKPARPDGKEEELGLTVVDEPAANQSDPTVLDLQLRALSKKSNLQPTHVRSIEHASRNEREISKWISSIADLHRSKPAPQVHYTKSMPDVDKVMEAWPAGFDAWLGERKGEEGLPSADMDLTVEEMSRLACALLDVPVYPSGESSLVQSLHVLFTVYHEFKTNPHFQQHMGGEDVATGAGDGGAASDSKWGGDF